MGYERNDRRFGRDQGYGYRAEGRGRDPDRGYPRGEDRGYARSYGGDYRGRTPDGYDYEDRGFIDRAGDEVRSWFGDEEAERRRRLDEQYAQREYERDQRERGDQGRSSSGAYSSGAVGTGYAPYPGTAWGSPDYGAGRGAGSTMNWGLGAGHDRSEWGHDPSYHSWRSRQIEQLDKDYADYRREHQQRFDTEFHTWRSGRQGQRDSLDRVQEHDEVVGSDGAHVGKVDHVRGDRILLTKSDGDAGGHHHSIPSAWISNVEAGKVTINRTADQAKQAWRDEERSGTAFFGSEQRDRSNGPHILNRSFSGTYRS